MPKGTYAGTDRRKKARLSAEDLNRMGLDAPGLKDSDLTGADRRSSFTKVIDVLDLPRNAVFNIIAELGGVPKDKLRKGALGMRVVTGSDVLRRMGVQNKAVLGIGGLAADIFGDPLTWLFPFKKGLDVAKGVPRVLKAGRGMLKGAAITAAGAGQKVIAAAPKATREAGGLLTKLRHVFPTAAEAAATKSARAAATKAVAASPETMRIAQAIGAGTKRHGPAEVMARLGEFAARGGKTAEQAAKRLAGRKSRGLLSQKLGKAAFDPRKAAGAREFLQEFGERGHRLLTVPLTEIGGPVLKIGKKRKLWEAMAKGGSKTLETVAAKRAVRAAELGKAAKISAFRDAAAVEKDAKLSLKAKWSASGQAALDKATAARKAAANALGKLPKSKKAMLEAQDAARLAQADAIAAQSSTTASIDFAERAKQMFGKTYPKELPPGASSIAKARNAVGRTFQKLFGHGQNFATRQVAQAKHTGSHGAYALGGRADMELAPAFKALADDIAKGGKVTAAEAMSYIYDAQEAGRKGLAGAAADLWATDPSLKRLADFQNMLTPEQSSKLSEILGRSFDISEGQAKLQTAAGVGQGMLSDPGSRVMAEGAKSSIRAPKDFAENRVVRSTFEITDPAARARWKAKAVKEGTATHWIDGDKYMALSRPGDDAQVRQLQGLVKEGKAKDLGTHQISAEQWNQWRSKGAEGPGAHLFDIEYAGEHFVKDPAKAIAARVEKSQRRLAQAQLRDVIQNYSAMATKEEMRQPGFRHMVAGEDLLRDSQIANTPFAAVIGDQIKGMAIPQPIADMVKEAARISDTPQEIGGLLRLLNYPLQIWKPLALFAPGYTLRNITQNRIGVMLQHGNPARMTKFGIQHADIVRDAIYGRDLGGKFVTVAGQKVPAAEVVKFWRENNLLQAGFTSMLIEPSMWQRTKSILGKAQRKFFELNNLIETTDRVGAWLEFAEQGYTWREAALKTVMSMPDLTDLTRFESGARNFLPWMAWTTHNTRNMIRNIARNPQLIPGTEHARRAIQTALTGDKNVDEQLRPEWMQEQQAMQIAGDEKAGNVFLLASWLPFNEIMTILEGAHTPSEFAKGLLSAIRPDVKVFAEMATGTDIFRRRPLAPFTTEELFTTLAAPKAVTGRSGTALDNLLAIRPIREGGRVALDMPTPGSKISRALIGGAIQPLTQERAMYDRMAILNEEEKKLRNEIKKAQRVGDNAYAQELAKKWARLVAEKLRLGLPGVAKSTQKSLQAAGVQAGAPAFAE